MTEGQYFYHRKLMPPMKTPSDVPSVYDRTQTVLPRPEIICITPLGDPKAERFTVDELNHNRAVELKELAGDRKIAVSWSGGIDSTVALIALMEVADVTVVMNDKSITEYPWFYEEKIKDKLPVIIMPESDVEGTVNRIINDGYMLVTGEIGDQMFGSIKYLEYVDQAELLKPWTVILEGLSEDSKLFYHTLVAACPVEMTTVKMFWWWFNYCLKYQGVQLRMMINAEDTKLNQNVYHFFDCKAWNDWTMYTDQEVKYPGMDPMNYKKPLKDYILDKTGDHDYHGTKGKVRSLIIYRGRFSHLYEANTIDKDWVRG